MLETHLSSPSVRVPGMIIGFMVNGKEKLHSLVKLILQEMIRLPTLYYCIQWVSQRPFKRKAEQGSQGYRTTSATPYRGLNVCEGVWGTNKETTDIFFGGGSSTLQQLE